MNTEQTELERLTGCLGQPAFYEEDGKVLFCNRLAEQARVRVGRDVAEMLPAGTALPEGGAAAHATLNLPGAQTAVTIVPWSKGRLYLLSPSDHAQLQPQALVAIAQSIRTPLSNLFGVAASLFPRLEAMEDDEIQQQTASMNRAFYQLLRLTCNLTDMRGVMLEEMRLLREKEELTGYFRRLFDRAAPLLKASGRRLVYTCGARPFCGWIDRQRLERAVWDILSNAAKFTPKDGVITAANASGINDAAAAVILMSWEKCQELGKKPMAKLVTCVAEGVAPEVMGLGPAVAMPKALKVAGLKWEDIDYFEVNEAFSAQVLGVERMLKEDYGYVVDWDKTNKFGSGIALGHPVGCTALRIIVTLVYEMIRSDYKYGMASLCVGGGPAMASIWTRDFS